MKATTKILDNKKPHLCCRKRVMTIMGKKKRKKKKEKERGIRDITVEKIQTKQGEALDVR